MSSTMAARCAAGAVAALAALYATLGATPAFAQSEVAWKADQPGVRPGCDMAYDSARSVVVLFGGAASTRGPFYLTMNTNDAVEAAHAFGRAAIVPVHHDGWAHFTQTQYDLEKTFNALGIGERLQLVEPGRTMRFE